MPQCCYGRFGWDIMQSGACIHLSLSHTTLSLFFLKQGNCHAVKTPGFELSIQVPVLLQTDD